MSLLAERANLNMLRKTPPVDAYTVQVEIDAAERHKALVYMWFQMIRAERVGASGTVVSAVAACSSAFCVSMAAGWAAVAILTTN